MKTLILIGVVALACVAGFFATGMADKSIQANQIVESGLYEAFWRKASEGDQHLHLYNIPAIAEALSQRKDDCMSFKIVDEADLFLKRMILEELLSHRLAEQFTSYTQSNLSLMDIYTLRYVMKGFVDGVQVLFFTESQKQRIQNHIDGFSNDKLLKRIGQRFDENEKDLKELQQAIIHAECVE